MQLIPRYLVNNKTTIIANEAGFITEYRPVYSRQLQVYKGIDNVLEFRILNADQKPIDISSYTPKFVAFDENKTLIISRNGTILQETDSSSTTNKGLFKVTIYDSELLNVKQQYLSYNIYLVDSNGNNVITYSDSHFGNSGTIYLSNEAFPGPKDTVSVPAIRQMPDGTYATDEVSAEPAINGNEALHTAVIYSTSGYVGSIVIQATLDNQIIGNTTNWADIASVSFTGSETQPTPINFNGVYSYLRFKASSDPADKISKILVRN